MASTNPSEAPQLLMTPQEVADVLRVSTMTVYRLINDGHIKALRVGRGLRIRKNDFDAYLEGGYVNQDHKHETEQS